MKRTFFLLFCLWVAVVGLWAKVHIADVKAETSLDNRLSHGFLYVQVTMNPEESRQGAVVMVYQLMSPQGERVAHGELSVGRKQLSVSFPKVEVASPCLWNAEKPALYELKVEVKNRRGVRLDEASRKVAFYQLRMNGEQVLVNGVPVRIKGVNFDWRNGYAPAGLTASLLEKEVTRWKEHHVNAVRVSEAPKGVGFAELCLEHGIYVLDESTGIDPTHPAVQQGCLWVWPNQDLPVKLEEMKKLYQDIRFVDFNREEGTVKVQNNFAFTSLDEFDFYYLVRDHGKEVYRGNLKHVKAAPGESVVSGPIKGYSLQRNTTGDVRIEFYATNRSAGAASADGNLVAREQTYIHTFFRPEKQQVRAETWLEEVVESADKVFVFGKDMALVFSRRTGQLVSYRLRGQELIYQEQGFRPFFWRAPTDNDLAAQFPRVLGVWKEASEQELVASSFAYIRHAEGALVVLRAAYDFPQTEAKWEITYKVYADGVVKVDNHFVAMGKQAAMIPRVGLRCKLTPALTTVRYFGRGPRANYRDCRTAQFLGEYESPIHEMGEFSSRPQENNHRTDIYWCALKGRLTGGLLLVADRTFEMNIGYDQLEDLEMGRESNSLSPVDFFVDYRMMGVGADNRKALPVQEPYLIRPGKENAVSYGFALVPFKKNEDFKSLILKYNE